MASTTPNNTSDLKAWVVWAKKQKDLSDDVPHFVKAVEDLISQASMVPALKAELTKMKIERDEYRTLYQSKSEQLTRFINKEKIGTTVCQHGTPTDQACQVCK